MKTDVPKKLESGRLVRGAGKSQSKHGFNGIFFVRYKGSMLKVVCSDIGSWEHVSVSLPNRCPTWDEMDFVKQLCWDDDEVTVQFHVNNSEKVNIHPFCLHIWKPKNEILSLPKPIGGMI